MATYFVDDGGSNSDPYGSWGAAATTLGGLLAAKTLNAGDIVYIGSDHVESAYASALSLQGVNNSSNTYVSYISRNISTDNYETMVAGGGSIALSGTSNDVVFNDSIVLQGLHFKTADLFQVTATLTEVFIAQDCKFEFLNINNKFDLANGAVRRRMINCDITWLNNASDTVSGLDLGGNGGVVLIYGGSMYAPYKDELLSEANANGGKMVIVGCDLSEYGHLTGTLDLIDSSAAGSLELIGCELPVPTTLQRFSATPTNVGEILIVHSDDTNDRPYRFEYENYYGAQLFDTATYMTGGYQPPSKATTALSHEITLGEGQVKTPFRTRDLGVKLEKSTGTLTATLEFLTTHATSAVSLTTDDIVLCLEYAGTASSVQLTHFTQEHDIITAPTTHPTGVGTGSWTYGGGLSAVSQKLSTSITINTANTLRRAWVEVMNIPTGQELFINPIVTLA